MIRELFLPRMKKLTERIEIYHSNGKLLPILDDLLILDLGVYFCPENHPQRIDTAASTVLVWAEPT